MAQLLKAAAVVAAMKEGLLVRADALRAQGVVPVLAIVRVGDRADDLAYERGAEKRCASVHVDVRSVVLPETCSDSELQAELAALNRDRDVHGILLLRPLPGHLDEAAACAALAPEKDVDGVTEASLAGVFAGSGRGYAPCTAQACMALLDYYGINCRGKRAVVLGRSLVIGKPAAMLLLQKNATVTICHSGTEDVPAVLREADIVIAATGKMESLGAACFRAGQTVIDVGMSWNEEKQKFCGDVRFEEAEPLVDAISPVPGGVGGVTTCILAQHVIAAAEVMLAS